MERKTFFASPERSGPERIRQEVEEVARDPAIDGVLRLGSGMLLILDENRQVVAANHALLRELGVDDPGEVLGLRPGEALGCVHAEDGPAGCGTTRYCASCGAAVAIVSSLSREVDCQRKCALAVRRNHGHDELCFLVRATPLRIGGRRYVLVYLRDITASERMVAMERAFFHDVNNTIMSLQGAVELLSMSGKDLDQSLVALAKRSLDRLIVEVGVQRQLVRAGGDAVHLHWQRVRAGDVLAGLEEAARSHPAAAGKDIEVRGRENPAVFATDPGLLSRILLNMAVNALEAAGPGDTVTLAAEGGAADLRFSVRNPQVIPPEDRLRIFQRHFSTKDGCGRGFGTYSMKLFGEEFLGGRVDFESREGEGTTFTFHVSAGGDAPPRTHDPPPGSRT